MKHGRLLVAGAIAALVATPASAAWYIKLPDIEGESLVTSMGFKGGVRVATGDVTGDGTADASADGTVDAADYTVWRDNLGTSRASTSGDGTEDIVTGAGAGGGPRASTPKLTESVASGKVHQRSDDDTSAAAGGGPHVKVFDGSTGQAAPAKVPGTRKYSNITLKRGVIDSNGQPAAPAGATPADVGLANEQAALLLPAVQKVREAAARMNAGDTCKIGPVRGPVQIRDSSDGSTARILDANVVSCDHETVTFTFSKIERD